MQTVSWRAADVDDPFLFSVYAAARQSEIVRWGWPDAEREAFLRMQYHCQQRSYQMQYPQLEYRIIQVGNQPAGRIILAGMGGGYVLVDIGILPDFQHQGIGTAMLKELQDSIASGEFLQLTVYKDNLALNLYLQLGFQVYTETELYFMMEWRNV